MAFQFLCPQGHLLQGEPSQTGQKCKCPYCQTEFLAPAPGDAPRQETAADQPDRTPAEPAEPSQQPSEGFPGIDVGGRAAAQVEEVPDFAAPAAEQQGLLHIVCPNGHVLETPRDMLGNDAMCPFCEAQFRLRFEDSQEHRREKAEQLERREQKLGTAWMNWAIAAAVVVVLGVIVLAAIASSR